MPIITITDCDFGAGEVERGIFGEQFELRLGDAHSEQAVVDAAADSEGLLVQWAPITADVLDALPTVRAIVRYGIGLDNIDLAAAAARGVTVRNVDDYCLNEVALHTTSLILARHRRLAEYGNAVRSGMWSPASASSPPSLSDEVVGIAGFGRIGRGVADQVAALGFQVVVWDPFADSAGRRSVGTIEDLAAEATHLSLHVPVTEATQGLVAADVLELLGPTGHLVNTGRGMLVDEECLLAALDSGSVGWASLDVLRTEPPSGTGARLAAHARTTVTPHVAYLSTDSLPTLRQHAAQRLLDALA
jgi:D-3-phosphoglycerate dehydrogenase